MKNELKLPRLMHDSSTKDGKAETIMDYVLSWCLRFAESKYSTAKPVLTKYCRFILGQLIDKKITDETNVVSVEVWKGWQYIDLTVEVIIDNNGIEEKHAILIENKYYTRLRENQLVRYKNAFLDNYKETDEWNKHYILISCLDSHEEVEEVYGEDLKSAGFTAFSFDQLINPECWLDDKKKYMPTESDIFNEFWFCWGDANY